MENKAAQWFGACVLKSPETTLDDLKVKTYWAKMMKSVIPVPALDKALGIRQTHAYLFCGPSGTGKRTVARALAGSLAEHTYQYVEFTAADLQTDTAQRLQELQDRVETGTPIIILCNLMQGELPQEAVSKLVTMLQNCEAENTPLVFIAIAEEESGVPEDLLRALMVCTFQLPNLEERTAYYKSAISTRFPLQTGLYPQDLAAVADGLQFLQMRRSLQFSLRALKEQAMRQYEPDYSAAAQAVTTKNVVLDLPMFRGIVTHLKMPEKGSVRYISFEEKKSAPAVPSSDDKESKSSKLKESKTVREFLDNL